MARSGGTDVGCSEFGRKPFRGLPGVDRVSGLYRGGDTRVLIVDPGHLKCASEEAGMAGAVHLWPSSGGRTP
eukprot:4691819-Prymnesium_polylepis.1